MKPLKWISFTYWVDIDTGEALSKQDALNNYRIIHKEIRHERTQYNPLSEKVGGIYNTAGVKHITNHCTREGTQGKLPFD